MASFDKALALARPLAEAYPQDRDVLRALATTLEAKGEVLSDTADAQTSTQSLQEAVAVYDRATALPGVTPPLIFEAAIAYETLGNELGEDTGMADIPAATAAYHRALNMDLRALQLDPGYMAVRKGIPLMHTHLGAVVLDTNPSYALGEFTLAQSLSEALPQEERRKLQQVRLLSVFLRKQAQAHAELGHYAAARTLFAQVARNSQQLVAEDSKNMAAVRDLQRVQDDWAQCEEYASDSVTAEAPAEVHRALASAGRHLEEEASILRQVVQQSPDADQSGLQLQSVQVRLSAVRARLHVSPDAGQAASLAAALASLGAAANRPKATANDLGVATSAFLQVGLPSLRRPDLAVYWAQRAASLIHHRSPAFLLLLAASYAANHQRKEAAEIAQEGLAGLPETVQRPPATHLFEMLRSFSGNTAALQAQQIPSL